ncbi:MAG: hypothetical protein WC375_02610 [Methanomassiliicoccales archaeon]|jgi:hypothetical protein
MASDKGGYERFGLTGNPFRDLSSDTIENIELFHVKQDIDAELESLYDDIFEKENKAVVILTGTFGCGKTERLLLLEHEARKRDCFCVRKNITPEIKWVTKGIIDGILEEAKARKVGGLFGPKWAGKLKKMAKVAESEYDPDSCGMAIADALSTNAPAFLLLNDMHGMESLADASRFLKTLHSMMDSIQPGVMILITSDEDYLLKAIEGDTSLESRVNRWIKVPKLTDHDAAVLIGKRLLSKRLVEDLQPFYPFTEEAISSLNRYVNGNPRDLLKKADLVLDHAAKRKAIQISPSEVDQVLSAANEERQAQ